MQSKLRNGSSKGRCSTRVAGQAQTVEKNASTATSNSGLTPCTSPTAFLPPRLEKRKSKDEPSSPGNGNDCDNSSVNIINPSGISFTACGGGGLTDQPQSLINPVTGLNVQINTKKCKPGPPCAVSPILLECPEQDCSKKYKHANGLRYHQSHAHGGSSVVDDDVIIEPIEDQTPSSVSPQVIPVKEPLESGSGTDLNEDSELSKLDEDLEKKQITSNITSLKNESNSNKNNLPSSALPSINFSSNSLSKNCDEESSTTSDIVGLVPSPDKCKILNLQKSPGRSS